jgi:Helix-turn-helix domain
VAEAALLTGLSRELLYDHMRIGKLAYPNGRRRVITSTEFETFLSRAAC